MHYQLATRFGRNAHQISGREPLDNEALYRHVPSIFANEAHDSRSQRYVYVPTIDIVEGLRREGWFPFFAVQSVPRDGSRHGHAKHMLRLRRDEGIGKPEAAEVTRANILVAGGTGSGKTTLVNALLAEVARTSDRIVLIEDTRELQCAAPNLVAMRTKDGVVSLSDLVRSSLRLRPDRIPIGEVRGAEALDLLKAWGTGHPGGIGTIHAGTALGALRRMEQLIQEAVVTVPRALLAETIDLIALLVRDGHGRRLAELARVEGLDPTTDDYRLTSLSQPQTGDLP